MTYSKKIVGEETDHQAGIKNIIEIKLGLGDFLGVRTSVKSSAQLPELIELIQQSETGYDLSFLTSLVRISEPKLHDAFMKMS